MTNQSERIRAIISHPAFIMAFWNAMAALFAFGRDVMTAMYLGTSESADAFVLSYFVPDMLGTCLIGPAIGTVCVPLYAKMLANNHHRTMVRTVKITALHMSGFTVAVFIICLWLSPNMSGWLSGGSGSLQEQTYALLVVMLPVIIISPLASVGAAVHQSLHRFTIPVLSPILVNAAFLVVLVAAMVSGISKWNGIYSASWGIVSGVFLMALLIWITLWKSLSVSSRAPEMEDSDIVITAELRKIWGQFWLYSVILFAPLAVNMAERILAARMETGAVAALNYAFRLSQFPVWVFAAAFSAAILPKLSKLLALRQTLELHDTLRQSLRHILLLTVPISVLLWLLREPVAILLLKRGAFDDNSVLLTSKVLQGYVLSVVFQSITAVVLRYFIAAESLKQPALLIALSSIFTIGLEIGLAAYFGVQGLGYGAAIGSLITVILIFSVLAREADLRPLIRPGLIIIASNIPSAILILWATSMLNIHAYGFAALFTLLSAAAFVYGAIYLWIVRRLRLLN